MSIPDIAAAVVFAAFAVSYGWGMRGYIIGGEKGAMLPGALLGFSIAFFCGGGQAAPLYPFFCAAGALSMFYGGTEPYAQTMSYILHRDDKNSFAYNNVSKGITGIFLKGALWYGIAGILLAMLPGALNGIYKKTDIIVLFLMIPVLSFVGTKIFNSPFDKKNKKFPRIYFSNGSREEWGGNVLILLSMMITALIRKDFFAFGAGISGILFGGLGFTVGLLAYDFNERKHNGKYFFGKLQEKRYIDGWKIMEHTFGAIGGGGTMLWFCLNLEHFTALCAHVTLNLNSTSFIKNGTAADTIFAYAVVGMLLLTAIQYLVSFFVSKKTGKEPDIHIFELIERPLFSAVPLIFVFLGYYRASCAVALLSVLYVLCEKCGIEWFAEFRNKKIVFAVYALVFIAFAVYFFATFSISPLLLILVYTFGYTASILYKSHHKEYRIKRKAEGKKIGEYYRSRITVDAHMFIQCVVITAIVLAVR